jgi:nuclease-like protein
MSATANRWPRFGHDRLYVTADDGTSLGYLDLKTGEVHDVPDERAEDFRAAVEVWRAEHPGARSPKNSGAKPKDAPSARRAPSTAPYVDLAENRPGQSAAEVADAHRQAQPVRSLADRWLRRNTDERAWRVGAQGEVETARLLRPLTHPGPFSRKGSGTWRVIHSIPLGSSGRDIDHFLIGPPGAYTINSKAHQALVTVTATTVMVGKHASRYAEAAADEAQRAAALLTEATGMAVTVAPLISVVGAPVVVRGTPRGVVVLAARELASWLMAQPTQYRESDIEHLHAFARRSTTWQPGQ